MRVSFISSLAFISVMIPLQGSAEQVGVVSSRSSLDMPSVFAVRKNPPSPTSAAFGIPRGGAGPVASAKAPVKSTSIVGGGLNIPFDIFSKEKLGWTISLAINLVYLICFFRRSINAPPECNYSEGGFCVTGLEEGGGCDLLKNSHTWAFLVDMVYTYLGLTVETERSKTTQYMLVFTIFSHGILHAVLGSVANCDGLTIPGGDQLFMVFTALISYAVLYVGAEFENYNTPKMLALSVGGGWLAVQLAGPNGKNGVSSIFLITQILASLSSVFFPGKRINNMEELGNSFVPPCLVSLIELVYCCDGDGKSLFNRLGGHVWYDFFLHRSVVVAINNGAGKKK